MLNSPANRVDIQPGIKAVNMIMISTPQTDSSKLRKRKANMTVIINTRTEREETSRDLSWNM
jgi:hypothetical protein